MSKLIWELGRMGTRSSGPADAASKEFVDIRAPRYRYTVPADWDKMEKYRLPQILSEEPAEGCRRLELTFSLNTGVYALYLGFRPPARQTVLQLLFDGRELDVYRAEDCFDRTGWCNPVEYRYPFVCDSNGEHTLAIDVGLNLNKGCKVYLQPLRLAAECAEPRPHPLRSAGSPRPAVDLWGWSGGLEYQREKPADLAYVEQKMIDEARKRGANHVQYQHAEPWAWPETDKIELLRHAHKQDFLADEFQLVHAFTLEECNVESSLEQQVEWLKNRFAQYADACSSKWNEITDGFTGEGWKVFRYLPMLHQALWVFNPGLYMEEVGCRPNLQPDLDMSIWIDMYVLNRPNSLNYIKGVMCCHHLVRTFMPGPAFAVLGYDDKDPIRLFPGRLGLTGEWGYVPLACQIDARPNWVAKATGVGGGTHADWVVKQVHDFLRPRAREERVVPELPLETRLELGESPLCTPTNMRDYVYAVAQDPLRGALAFELKTTGKGGAQCQKLKSVEGRFDSISRRVAEKLGREQRELQHLDRGDMLDLWTLRPRDEYPADTCVIQNNYLRLNILSCGERILQYDLEQLAHFDSNSLSLVLADDVVSTNVAGSTSTMKGISISRKGGYRAEIIENWEIKVKDGVRLSEQRRYEMISDTPYVRVILDRKTGDSSDRINRIKEKQCGPVRTRLNTKGYDRLVTDRKKWDLPTSGKTSDVPGILSLEDSSRFRPPLFVLLIEKGHISEIEWNSGGELSLVSKRVKDEKIDIAVVVGTDLYSRQDMPELCEFLKEKGATFSCQTVPVLVRNERKIPVVKVVRMEGAADDQPYMVEENGWWQVRGAQRALDDTEGIDWLKLYVPAKGSVRVQPHGFVGGAAKPGWGCQYTVSLGKISKKAGKTRCRVRVATVTPYVFAPRVEFTGQIASARVNGRDWHYFDEGILFLPNIPGEYDVEVETGVPRTPHLRRTYALVSETAWDGRTFSFYAQLPPWATKMHPDSTFFALLDIRDLKFYSINGGVQGRATHCQNESNLLVKHRVGEVAVHLE